MAAHKGPTSLRPRCTRGGGSVAAIQVYQSTVTTVGKRGEEQGNLDYFQYDFNPTNAGRGNRLSSAPKVDSGSRALMLRLLYLVIRPEVTMT
jgi:hypothetical protein